MQSSRCAVAALTIAFILSGIGVAAAQDYPSKPIRMVVPQTPGGATDIVARLLATKLGESLGQQVVVDDRPGAGGIVGAELVAKSAPDGYTLLMGYTGCLTINPSLHKKLPYRPEDFDPISLAVASPLVLVAHPSLRVASVGDLVALSKIKTAPLNYGSPGNGSLHHLAMEWFKSATGANFTHVPYKGSQALNAVIAGEVSFAFNSVIISLPHIKSGRVTALAITSKTRSRLLPDLPTIAESGVPDFEARNWFGVLAPHGTPKPIIARLGALIATHMNAAAMKERFLNDGAEAIGSTPAAFASLIATELKRWKEVVRMSGATLG